MPKNPYAMKCDFCLKTGFKVFVNLSHTCHKLWTKICEIRQNFMGDLTKFCEIFLNITCELPRYSLKPFLSCKKLVKTSKCVICVYFIIKSVVNGLKIL